PGGQAGPAGVRVRQGRLEDLVPVRRRAGTDARRGEQELLAGVQQAVAVRVADVVVGPGLQDRDGREVVAGEAGRAVIVADRGDPDGGVALVVDLVGPDDGGAHRQQAAGRALGEFGRGRVLWVRGIDRLQDEERRGRPEVVVRVRSGDRFPAGAGGRRG